MNKNLLNAIVDMVGFFANCEDDECDPDSAVKMLENIAFHLHQLTVKQKEAFASHCEQLAQESDSTEMSDFLRQVPTNLGL